jgi:hypothetical protein
MKMLKYLNKRIFVCLSLVVLFLIVASFVASSMEERKGNGAGVGLFQSPMSFVTEGTNITFNWSGTQPGPPVYYDKYRVLIDRPPEKQKLLKNGTIPPGKKFSGDCWWVVPSNEPKELWHTATILVQCEEEESTGLGPLTSSTAFKVVETLLVIQKFNDTNRNYEIDTRDEGLPKWEFKVTDHKGKTTSHFTKNNGEKRIVIDPGEYKITEIIKEPDKWQLIKKDTKAPIVGEGKQWIKIFVEAGKESKVTFLNNFSPPPTKLIIRKFDDTNRNGRIDGGDERLQGWEFKVTDPGGNTKPYTTTSIPQC